MTLTVIPGQVLPDVPHLGHWVPLGTEISPHRSHQSDRYTQEAPRTWVGGTGRSQVLMDTYLYSQPLYLAGDGEIVLPVETEREFRWRLRDSALGAGERSGVSIPAIRDMCREFGSGEPLLTVGGVVSNDTDLQQLPPGSVVYLGHPSTPDHVSAWEVNARGRLDHLVGMFPDRPRGAPVVIHSMPGVDPVRTYDEPPITEERWASIAQRAWKVGRVYKARQSWCGVFENMLATLGINEQTVAKAGGTMRNVNEDVDRAGCALLPEGTILWHQWRSNQRKWAVWVRDDSATNKSRTKRLAGENDPGEQSHDIMTIVGLPGEGFLWQVTGYQMAYMPDGVLFRRYGYDDSHPMDAERRSRIISHHYYSITGWPS